MLESILHFLRALYDPEGLKELIRAGGAPLICLIVFVETGFFVGFFLPGDSLLITAGIFAAAGVIPLKYLLAPVMLCAIVGDQIGYWIGRTLGPALYQRHRRYQRPYPGLSHAALPCHCADAVLAGVPG